MGGAAEPRPCGSGRRFTSTGELVLQQHQVDGAGAARCPVALHDADVRAAAVVPRARVFACKVNQVEAAAFAQPFWWREPDSP